MRFKYKYLKAILVYTVVIIVTRSLMSSEYALVNLNKFRYRVNEIVSDVMYLRLGMSPSDVYSNNDGIVESNLQQNYECPMPEVGFNTSVAFNFLHSDATMLKVTLNSCGLSNNATTPLGRLADLYHVDVQSSTLTLHIHLVEAKFKQARQNLNCFLQKFDKKMNESEQDEEIDMFAGRILLDDFNYSVPLDKTFSNPGCFYYLCCVNLLDRNSKLFDTVINLFPMHMSHLINERKQYARVVDAFKSNLPRRPDDVEKLYDKIELPDLTEEKIINRTNVLLIGIDSVSSNHFRRIFPQTYAFLTSQLADSNVIFEHFNSIGANTYPNLIGMLTGIIEEDLNDEFLSEIDYYRRFDGTFHDHLPYIWYEYEKLGYLTMFQEDDPSIGIFNFNKDGFRYWPTGLFQRGFWLKYYQIRSGPDKCHFDEPTYRTWLEQIEQFVRHMGRNESQTPYFSLNFLTEYTHGYLAIPWQLDRDLAEMLRRLERDRLLDETMLVLFTDHGNRLKFFAYATEIGKLEKYRPFLSVKLPNSYARRARLWHNFSSNRPRLISFFDVYQTLRHNLYINKYGLEDLDKKAGMFAVNERGIRSRRGVSLFERVPTNRSCMDALIGDKFCTCFKQENLTEELFLKETGENFRTAGYIVLDYVNGLTDSIRVKCRLFQVERVVSVKKLFVNKLHVYSMVIILQPGDAWFETSLKLDDNKHHKEHGHKLLKVNGDPIRLSAYGKQSACIKHPKLVNYCYCENYRE